MRFITPRIHGALDYAVAVVLIGAPLLLGFAESSVAAASISIAGGVGLLAYSLVTDYAAGIRRLISFRLHLAFDTLASLALLAAPLVFGFGGLPALFYWVVGGAVLLVVAATQPESPTELGVHRVRAASGAAS